jgi:hypothetical protein
VKNRTGVEEDEGAWPARANTSDKIAVLREDTLGDHGAEPVGANNMNNLGSLQTSFEGSKEREREKERGGERGRGEEREKGGEKEFRPNMLQQPRRQERRFKAAKK